MVLRAKFLGEMYENKLEFPGGGGGGGCKTKNLLWGEYGYFLEQHNSIAIVSLLMQIILFCIHLREQTILELLRVRAQAWHCNDGNNESEIKQHAETTGHGIHHKYVELLERGMNNQQKCLFLVAL